jgi:hypothetical protein
VAVVDAFVLTLKTSKSGLECRNLCLRSGMIACTFLRAFNPGIFIYNLPKKDSFLLAPSWHCGLRKALILILGWDCLFS